MRDKRLSKSRSEREHRTNMAILQVRITVLRKSYYSLKIDISAVHFGRGLIKEICLINDSGLSERPPLSSSS